jgi:ribonuclease BN (tRNA processing enzyme)
VTASGLGVYQYQTTFIINDTVAIDAGSLGSFVSPADQAKIKHVFLSHTHVDHVGSLPVFLENAYEGRPECVVLHGTREVLDSIHKDLLNDRIWPDFIRLSHPKAPFVKLSELTPFVPVEVEGLRLTPVPVVHVVPTCGFIIEDGTTSLVLPADTAPTTAIWERASATPHVKALFLEATFPNNMAWLADVSQHLIPKTFASEVAKLQHDAEVFAVHIKPRYRDEVVRELEALSLPRFAIAEPGKVYTF